MAPFQAKIGSKTQRNRENKNFHSVPTRREIGIPKNSKKIQKIKKYHYGFLPSQNRFEKAEKEPKH